MEEFTPIAMKCTQEQFDAVKPKLVKAGKIGLLIEAFERYDYITNNYGNEVNYFDFIDEDKYLWKFKINKIYHEWNEEIFLKACGIETKTLQEKEPLNNKNMVNLMGYSVLVDNKEQARKLQEIAIGQGFKWSYDNEKIKHLDEKSFQFGYGGKKVIAYNSGGNHYQDEFITKTAHFNDLFKEETLQEKAIRLENELKEVQQQIEEESKPKINDWVYNKEEDIIYQKSYNIFNQYEKKLINPELIKLLEQEIK